MLKEFPQVLQGPVEFFQFIETVDGKFEEAVAVFNDYRLEHGLERIILEEVKKINPLPISSVKLLRWLINNGVDIEIKKTLQRAIEDGYLDTVKYLVENGADIRNVDSWSLGFAIRHGHLDTVKYLVENGADIRDIDYWLEGAAAGGHFDTVKYLVENGVDIRDIGRQLMLLASRQGRPDIMDLLQQHGAKKYRFLKRRGS
jgi:hypothetical protein